MQHPEHAEHPATTAATGSAERFIPFRRSDLVDMLDEQGLLGPADAAGFRDLAGLCTAIFHHDFHARLETLKDAYAPFDPDPDTLTVRTYDAAERERCRRRLFDGLRELLEDGNFEPIDDQDLRRAFADESLLKIRLEVDTDDFEEVLFFRRGETVRQEEVATWFGLRRRTVTFTNYEKVLVLVTFKNADQLDDADATERAFTPGSTILKLFQDVPRADLEMLYPNAQPRMRPIDKLMIGVPAAAGAIAVLSSKLITTVGLLLLLVGFWLGITDEPVELDQTTLVALGAGLGSIGGYVNRQLSKFKRRKMEFMKALADNLYFRNLDNDTGVLHHLNDDAEEEEVKEALLGWYFLRAAERGLTLEELDRRIEEWFADVWDARLDFEVDDGVAKLRDLRLVDETADGHLTAVPVDEALVLLDERWDDYFVPERATADRGASR